MSRTALPARKLVKMSDEDAAKLKALSEALSLEASATIRMLIAEKCLALGINVTPRAPAPAKKKRPVAR